MTKTIWKYDLPAPAHNPAHGTFTFGLHMPVGAEIVCLDKQRDEPRLWVLLNPDITEREHQNFIVAATGQMVHDATLYIGSWQMEEGAKIWHLFKYVEILEGKND